MKDFRVSYYLGDFFHCYIVEAENEHHAISKTMCSIPNASRNIMHDFKMERYVQEWN